MAQAIHETEDFIGLSHFITKLSDRNKNLDELTRQQSIRLKSLISPVLLRFQKDLESNSLLDQEQKTLSFLLSAISLYLRQNPEKDLESQILKLKEDIISAQTKSLDDQQDIISNAENSLISRITEKLNLPNTITTEDELTNYLIEKISDSDPFLPALIKAFNIPSNIQKNQIIPFLQNQFKQSPVNNFDLKNVSNLHSNDQPLSDLQIQLEDLQNDINTKNEHIKRLRDEKSELKSQLKEAQKSLQSHSNNGQEEFSSESLINIEIEQLKSELLKAKMENKKKDNQIEQQSQFIQKYEDVINNLENENSELKDINTRLSKINQQSEIPETDLELQRKLDKKNAEYEQLKTALDDLATQFDQQNTELAEITSSRLQLITNFQRLDEACAALESKLVVSNNREQELTQGLNEALKKIEEYEEKEKQNQKEKFDHNIQNSIDMNFLSSIEQLVNEAFPESGNQIREISHNDQSSPAQRVKHLFTFVIESIKEKVPVNISGENENERYVNLKNLASKFYSASLSQLKLIREFANNKQIQTWIANDEEDITTLKMQCVRMESFIADNCSNLKRSSNLFDILLLQTDQVGLSARLSEFIETYKSAKTNEGKELFLMLVQALTANDVLQKYALEAHNHCDIQSRDIKRLRNIIENQNAFQQQTKLQSVNDNFLTESEIDNNLSSISPKADNSQRIKNIVRNAIGKGHDLQTMLKCLESLDSPEIDEKNYAHKLEKKLSKQLTELTKLREKLNSMTADNNEELKSLKEKSYEISKELQDRSKEIEKLEKESQNKNDEISKLQNQIKEKEEEVQILNQKHSEELNQKENECKLQMEAEIAKIQEQYNEIANHIQENLNQLQEHVKCEEQKKLQTIQSYDQDLIALSNENKKLQKKLQHLFEERNSMQTELSNRIIELENKEQSLLNELKKLGENNKELQSEIKRMVVERKLMNNKLNALEGKLQREKQNCEAQLKLHQLAVENETKAKIEKYQNEVSSSHKSFLAKISEMFPEMSDIMSPINDDTTQDLLQKVRERLTQLDKESFAADESNIELIKIKKIIEPIINSKNMKVSTAVAELYEAHRNDQIEKEKLEKELNDNKKEVLEAKSIIKQNLANKEWEDWSKKIYAMISDGFSFSKTPKEMRSAIENVIFTSIGDKIIWRWLDCLRCEKRLIIKGVLRVKPKRSQSIHLTQLISITFFIGRLQKLSGHSISNFSLFKDSSNFDKLSFTNDNNDMKKTKRTTNGSKVPLFSQFVLQPSYLGSSTIDNV